MNDLIAGIKKEERQDSWEGKRRLFQKIGFCIYLVMLIPLSRLAYLYFNNNKFKLNSFDSANVISLFIVSIILFGLSSLRKPVGILCIPPSMDVAYWVVFLAIILWNVLSAIFLG